MPTSLPTLADSPRISFIHINALMSNNYQFSFPTYILLIFFYSVIVCFSSLHSPDSICACILKSYFPFRIFCSSNCLYPHPMSALLFQSVSLTFFVHSYFPADMIFFSLVQLNSSVYFHFDIFLLLIPGLLYFPRI